MDDITDDLVDEAVNSPYINQSATALYSAGFLFGWSKNELDKQAEIVTCYTRSDKGDQILQTAYAEFAKRDFKAADDQMVLFLDRTRHDMQNCSLDIRQRFSQIDYERNRFFTYPTSEDMLAFNLRMNGDLVESLYENMMAKYGVDNGAQDFFNAGFLYGRIFNIITQPNNPGLFPNATE